MNTNDTELVRAILSKNYIETDEHTADIVMLNTCAIRDSAEQKIYQRVHELNRNKIIAVLGCMAERVKEKMIERGVHIVCGPDSYRELPRLIEVAKSGDTAIDVQLSVE
jgi:tRNA-2-methylthio-N6-dimethylallyladenosine synthase